MTPRTDDLSQLRMELGQAVRDVRQELSALRTDLAGTYVTNAGLGGITAAWSTTLEKIELAMEAALALQNAQLKDVREDVAMVKAWGTWLLRIVLGVIVVGVLGLLGLSAGTW